MNERISRVRAIGFGANSTATLADVLALVHATTDAVAGAVPMTVMVATLRARAPLGREVAAALGCKLVLFAPAELALTAARAPLLRHSARAFATVGTPSVAEAAALAALGPCARLVIARTTGRCCTCALAELS